MRRNGPFTADTLISRECRTSTVRRHRARYHFSSILSTPGGTRTPIPNLNKRWVKIGDVIRRCSTSSLRRLRRLVVGLEHKKRHRCVVALGWTTRTGDRRTLGRQIVDLGHEKRDRRVVQRRSATWTRLRHLRHDRRRESPPYRRCLRDRRIHTSGRSSVQTDRRPSRVWCTSAGR